jgi:hypothetical protein
MKAGPLTKLELPSKQLTRIKSPNIIGFFSEINLSSNLLRRIPQFAAVTTLNLDNNCLRYIDGLDSMPALSALSLRNNLIDEAGLQGLQHARVSLESLALDGNPVTKEKDSEALQKLIKSLAPSLKVLDNNKL